MRQRDALEAKREQARKERELLEIARLNSKRATSSKPRSKRARASKRNAPPSNMVLTSSLDLVSDDDPVAGLFGERLRYRDASRDTSHKRRRNRNDDVIASSIRTPRSRTRNDYHYNQGGERSKRPA